MRVVMVIAETFSGRNLCVCSLEDDSVNRIEHGKKIQKECDETFVAVSVVEVTDAMMQKLNELHTIKRNSDV